MQPVSAEICLVSQVWKLQRLRVHDWRSCNQRGERGKTLVKSMKTSEELDVEKQSRT
jgi:hypothetical protein